MCGRYSLVKKSLPKEHRNAAKFTGIELEPADNAAPSKLLPVMALNSIKAKYLYWRWLPAWANHANAHLSIYARAETLTTDGMFRSLLSRKRCLVPADGF